MSSRFAFAGLKVHQFHELVDWDNCWDATDPGLITYAYDGTDDWAMAPATRVAEVPDRGTNPRALRWDSNGDYGDIGSAFGGEDAPVPGCLWVPTDSKFAGRPSWYSDKLNDAQGFFDGFHSMLTPNLAIDGSDDFGYTQPWWQAILVAPGGYSGLENVLIDGNPGGSTMGAEPSIILETWNSFASVGGTITSGVVPTAGKGLMIIWKVNGASTWIDISRVVAGQIVTSRHSGTNGGAGVNLTTQHTGWSHSHYMSAWGIGQGTPDEADVDRVRAWGTGILKKVG